MYSFQTSTLFFLKSKIFKIVEEKREKDCRGKERIENLKRHLTRFPSTRIKGGKWGHFLARMNKIYDFWYECVGTLPEKFTAFAMNTWVP